MLVKTYGSAVYGVDAKTITIEVNAGGPIQVDKVNFYLVGLPDSAIREGQQRIYTAISNSGYRVARVKFVINMAPADIRKEGAAYDLPIAIGMLAASKVIEHEEISDYVIMGELSLDGSIRPIKGALPIAIQARKEGFKGLIVPKENSKEAAIVDKLEVFGASHIREVIDFFNNKKESLHKEEYDTRQLFHKTESNYEVDFADVKGQENIKRALELAAAGGHNVILIGPPGAGKTMLARRMPTILPPLSLREALETTKIHSVAGILPKETSLITARPFRSPHHTVSDAALVGGGSNPKPGEISLAHNGVLFLDELPEFQRSVLEVLRQPLEERKVTISRAKITVDYPSSLILVASMNPCVCGFYNHPTRECSCGPGQVKRYLSKISGPLLDRIDLHVEVVPVSYEELASMERPKITSEQIRERVIQARMIQEERYKDFKSVYCNAQLPSRLVREYCQLDETGQNLLKTAMEKLQLSARAYDRILKVARTAADLAGATDIGIEHISEAIHFRSLDRESWGG